MRRHLRKILAAVLEFHAKIAARSYFVGPRLEDALGACRRLERLRVATTVAYWNAVDESPPQVAAAYLSALEEQRRGPECGS